MLLALAANWALRRHAKAARVLNRVSAVLMTLLTEAFKTIVSSVFGEDALEKVLAVMKKASTL